MFFQGALVGGPNDKDEYEDRRNNYQQSEVALDYNAGFQGLMAGLFHHAVIKGPNKVFSSIPEKQLQSTLKNKNIFSSAKPKKLEISLLSSTVILLFLRYV